MAMDYNIIVDDCPPVHFEKDPSALFDETMSVHLYFLRTNSKVFIPLRIMMA